MLELEPLAARHARQPAHVRPCSNEIGLRCRHGGLSTIDLELTRLLVDLSEEVALLDAIVGVHEYTRNLASHARRNERHMPVHEGIVSRYRGQGRDEPRHPLEQEKEDDHTASCKHPPSPLGGATCSGRRLTGCRSC